MVAPSGYDKLASILDQSTSRWDLCDPTAFNAFEREMNNALATDDMLELVKHGPPTRDIILASNPSLKDEAAISKFLAAATTDYVKVDTAAQKTINKLINWKKAPGRLAEIAKVEKEIGRPSGHELYKFIYMCRDKSSYQDQKVLKKEYANITIPYGAGHELYLGLAEPVLKRAGER